MVEVFGDRTSDLVIAGHSLVKDFSGNVGNVPYQVLLRRGLMLGLSERS